MNFSAYPFGRWIKWAVLGFIAVIILVSMVSTYNGLVTADQEVQRSWSQVENVMQSRADTVNNLVATVKGAVKHEEKVFEDIASARSVLMSGSADVNSKMAADQKIANATRDVLVLVENYPEIKATEQFTNLQTAIEGSERRVAVERKRFIEAVQAYNNKVTRFPGNIFARLMGFSPKEYFVADPEAQKAPEVTF